MSLQKHFCSGSTGMDRHRRLDGFRVHWRLSNRGEKSNLREFTTKYRPARMA
jgi:hypothetical protein